MLKWFVMDPSYQGRMPHVPYNYNNRSRGGFRLSGRSLVLVISAVLAVIIGIVLLTLSGDKSGQLQQRLVARLATLDRMATEGDKNIKSGDLREFNGRLKIQLASELKSIGSVTKAGPPTAEIKAAEADKASFDNLAEAQLNSQFDDAYRKLIAQKLDSTTALIKELYGKTTSASLKKELNSTYSNLEQLETQITKSSTP